jgi:D-3-phosphoglycerate dehydrogenase
MKKEKLKILITYPKTDRFAAFFSTEFRENLKKVLAEYECEISTPSCWTEQEISRLAVDTDIILGSTVSHKVLGATTKLKLVQTIGSGADKIDVEFAAKRGVPVCSTTGLNAVWVSEHAVALILALAKNLVILDGEIRHGMWQSMPSQKLQGKTLGIVGLGSIGAEIAKRMRAFGMRIVAIKRHPSAELMEELGLDFLGSLEDLEHVMMQSDFLAISVALTSETRRMIGKRELDIMKKTAFLVNVSRGEVVDEKALILALTEKKIAGAGLDVFEKEPIMHDNPLLGMRNVILTPHVGWGGDSYESAKERTRFIGDNIVRVMHGGMPLNIIDPCLGYAVKHRVGN